MALLLAIGLLIVFCALVAFYWYWTIPENLPPGPRGLPLLGSTLDTWDVSRNHLLLQGWARQYGSLFKFYITNKLVVVLGDYEAIQEALIKQGPVFAGRPNFLTFVPDSLHTLGLLAAEGDLWKEQRRFALSTLRDFGVGRPILEGRIREEVHHLLEAIGRQQNESSSGFDMHRYTSNAIANVTCAMVFGRRYDYEDKRFGEHLATLSRRTSRAGINFLSPLLLCKWMMSVLKVLPMAERLKKEGDRFVKYIADQIEQTQSEYDPESEPKNYVHAFMKAADAKQGEYFTKAQLVSVVLDLFGGGTETTSSTIRWAIIYLAHDPELQEKVSSEIRRAIGPDRLPSMADRPNLPLTTAVLMETNRLSGVSPLAVAHRTTRATKLMGYDIPEDTLVVPLLWNVLHDPKVFPNPDEFDPYRFLDADGKVKKEPSLIPFSTGKRVCVGESLAQMELFLFITSLLAKFQFTFPHDEPRPTIGAKVGFIRSPAPFKICVKSRKNDLQY